MITKKADDNVCKAEGDEKGYADEAEKEMKKMMIYIAPHIIVPSLLYRCLKCMFMIIIMINVNMIIMIMISYVL